MERSRGHRARVARERIPRPRQQARRIYLQGSLPAERPRQTHELAPHVSSGVQIYLGPATSAAAVDELAGNLKISHVQSRVGERCCGSTAYRERGERRASVEVDHAEQLLSRGSGSLSLCKGAVDASNASSNLVKRVYISRAGEFPPRFQRGASRGASASCTLSVRTTPHTPTICLRPLLHLQHRRSRRHHRRQGGAMGQWCRHRCVVLETSTEDSSTKALV